MLLQWVARSFTSVCEKYMLGAIGGVLNTRSIPLYEFALLSSSVRICFRPIYTHTHREHLAHDHIASYRIQLQ